MALLKVVEIMASSEKSWDDATKTAITTAGKTIKGIRSAYVQDMSVVVKENNITEFRVTLKISFEVIA